MFLQAMLIAICYTASQDQRGASAHWFVLTIPAQLMPYCLLLLELLMAGPDALFVGMTGLVAAHLHDFLTRLYPEFGNGPNLLPTPWFLSYIIRTPRVQTAAHGTSFAPPRAFGGRDGPLPDSWRSKGPGRRLG
jgi:Derlin-2/3